MGKCIAIVIILSCTEMIRDAEPVKGNSTQDKVKEKKCFLYVNQKLKIFSSNSCPREKRAGKIDE